MSFVRDLGSRDIFTSPLSSGAAAFSVSRDRRTRQVTLDVPDEGPAGHAGSASAGPRAGADAARRLRGRRGHPAGGALEDARPALALLPQARAHRRRRRRSSICCCPSTRSSARSPRPAATRTALLAGNLNPFKRTRPAAGRVLVRHHRRAGGPGSVDYARARHLQRHAARRRGRRRRRRDRRRRDGRRWCAARSSCSRRSPTSPRRATRST